MKLDDVIFILGAGSSVPYGYPTANQLRQNIIHNNSEVVGFAYNYLVNKNEIEYSWWQNHWKPFINQFDQSNTESIDLFLTRNKNTVDTELGIFLILYHLIWYELKYKSIKFDQDWYFSFYNELTREITEKNQLYSLVKNPIQFITFNYDRSLEYFLYTSLMNSFSLDQDEAKNIYNMLFNVHHVYGKISKLEFEFETGIRYSDNKLFNKVHELINNIKLIYNDREHIPDSVQAQILNKQRIFILGFGFAKANLDKLNLKNLLNKEQKLFATGLNLFDSQIVQIKQMLRRGLVGIREEKIQIEQQMDSLQLLQTYLF